MAERRDQDKQLSEKVLSINRVAKVTKGGKKMSFSALLVVGDWLWVDKEHAHTQPEHWFGFWSVFGFVACVVIIFVSKWYGHRGIMTREDYYGDK